MNRPLHPLVPALIAFGLIFATISLMRALGFGSGVALAATPASALALAAGVLLRGRGALAAGLGFAAACLAWGAPPVMAAADGAAHGLAALCGSVSMRLLARRRTERSKTTDWLIFLVGVVVFSGVVVAVLFAAARIGAIPDARDLRAVAAFEPLGLMTFCAVLANLREARRVWADPAPALPTAILGLILLGALWLSLNAPFGEQGPSGVTLMMSVPFCMWISMQRRSLDGAVLSFLAALLVLGLLYAETGSIFAPEFVRAVIYLNLLVATCQFLHAINLDRLDALAEVETQKRELEIRVVERTARLTAANEAVLMADAAKTRFVAQVSHEVRTPLSGVLGMAAVVLDGPLEPQVRRNIEVIRTSGLHLLDVINRLLDFSRLDRPPRPSEIVDFDLGHLVDEVLQEARCLPYAAGLTLRREDAPGIRTPRRGYRQGLRQVLTNLVGNAAKFTDRGSVTVRVMPLAGEGVRIEVADTGIGIAASVRERIFLAYEQVGEASVGRFGGTGLGLAICVEIVKRLEGRIGVVSEPGAGSVFWLELEMPILVSQRQPREEIAIRA